MPIFEYRCAACDSSFEELTSASAADPVRCRYCGNEDVTRLLSAFAVGGGNPSESGPCGACGAPRRGMCGEG